MGNNKILDIRYLTMEDGEFLVRLARKAVTYYLKFRKRIAPPDDTPSKLWKYAGVFVTINKHKVHTVFDKLRGCIGYPRPVMSLVEATIDAAIQAAFFDPRFKPLQVSELNDIVFEVSVLSKPVLIEVPKRSELPRHIEIGRDGLIIEKDIFSGLLLPQVPVEFGWDSEIFLMQACLKAGLPPDAWLDPDTRVYRFEAVIFCEVEPEGKVIKRDLRSEKEHT